ncbi:CPBP family intramembrane glutamic endopeptidase [Bacillus sp. JJ722]|uniref:CPBP family intramembrane glutamic endopeptidase n=1 Tax=Bacillus sp. JJ722 TaxID=3122973 RepID=UPI00300017CD
MNFSLLFISLIAISIPGIWVMSIADQRLQNQMETEKTPMWLSIIVHSSLVLIFTAIGSALIVRVTEGEIFLLKEWKQAVVVGIGCSVIHIIVYYGIFKRIIHSETFFKIERFRNSVGISARLLYASIIEEIIFRFGIMTLMIWVFQFFVNDQEIIVWTAIVISSLLFTLAHFIGISEFGKSKTAVYSYAIVGNMWVGVLCGWQYWTNGIFAAIIVHMLFHLLLYPIEKYHLNKYVSG